MRRMIVGMAMMVLAAMTASEVRAAINISLDFVTVGNAGNMSDVDHDSYGLSYGRVDYNYQIGKFEVTAGQYTAFLNAVAATDTYGLYNSGMFNNYYGYGCHIQQHGLSGSYTYSVADDWANRPVNYVSFWDAARFVNWLHNGQGNGDTESGAYANIGNQITFTRLAGAKYFIPTENEWYKAAYHKNDGVTGNYWDYPTGSDTAPGRDMADASGNNANYYGDPFPIDSHFTTVVGEFENSESPYGTFDQGGNLWEWNETAIFSGRGMTGGVWYFGSETLLPSHGSSTPTDEGFLAGFRVASLESVPEPSALAVWSFLSMAGIGCCYWRKRKQ
ncbi:MAG: formylglycine-generating enzyme family protein [Pirellulaceae bacterium]